MAKRRNRRKPPKIAPPSPSDVTALNRAFYAADPAVYFDHRLRRLIEIASTTDAEDRAERRTVRAGEITATIPSAEDEPADERAYTQFVLLEVEMLAHHLAETLLRLFLAHRSRELVPWIELANLRTPGEFKRAIDALGKPENTNKLTSDIGWVWLGNPEPQPGVNEQHWANFVDGIRDYVLYFADLLLDRAAAYNAAKHGLGVSGGETKLTMPSVPGMHAEGPSLAWLSLETDPKTGVRWWGVRNRWVNLDLELTIIHIGCKLLTVLWTIARARYRKAPLPDSITMPPLLTEILKHSVPAYAKESGMAITEVAFPPDMFSPPQFDVAEDAERDET